MTTGTAPGEDTSTSAGTTDTATTGAVPTGAVTTDGDAAATPIAAAPITDPVPTTRVRRMTARDRRTAPGRGDERRDALMDALERQLRTRRLDEISVGDLSREAGVTRSAFYFYFDSKASAVLSVLAAFEEEAELSAEELVSGAGTLRERVTRVLDRLAGRVDAAPHLYRAVVEVGRSDEGVRSVWDEDRRRLAAPIARWVEDERAAGRMPAGPDAGPLAAVLVRLNEDLMEYLAHHPESDRGPLVEALTEIWVRSLLAEAPDRGHLPTGVSGA